MLLKESKTGHTGKILTVTSVESTNIKRALSEIRNLCDSSAINQQLRRGRTPADSTRFICSVGALLIALTIAPIVVLAGGGNVLPGPAKPRGYSLSDMAAATAFFNTGDHSLDTYPDTPFQILYVPKSSGPGPYSFTVSTGTMLYVPIFFSDDSPPVIGEFPTVNDRQAVLNYVYSPMELGAIDITIVVDGTKNSLGSDYVFGVGPVKLGDGPGTQYIGFAAFLTPLNKGTHTVEIIGSLNGAALLAAVSIPPGGFFQFDIQYIVSVR
jgi:hypothetical protein